MIPLYTCYIYIVDLSAIPLYTCYIYIYIVDLSAIPLHVSSESSSSDSLTKAGSKRKSLDKQEITPDKYIKVTRRRELRTSTVTSSQNNVTSTTDCSNLTNGTCVHSQLIIHAYLQMYSPAV